MGYKIVAVGVTKYHRICLCDCTIETCMHEHMWIKNLTDFVMILYYVNSDQIVVDMI